MHSLTHRLGLRAIVGLLLTTALLFILAVPTYAGEQTATDSAGLKQTTVSQAGDTAAGAQSAAISGVAVALSQAQIHQINVQVIAGPKETRDDSTQTATNTAVVNQDTVAASGDATASDGGTAITGSAIAHSLAIVHQINIQIIAGHAPSGGVTQAASNTAVVDQATAALSGDAGASGSGSTATSGSATANSVSVVQQKNIQIFVGKPNSNATEPVTQTATNAAGIDQTTVAMSGSALAHDGGKAVSGNARAMAKATVDQVNKQIVK